MTEPDVDQGAFLRCSVVYLLGSQDVTLPDIDWYKSTSEKPLSDQVKGHQKT